MSTCTHVHMYATVIILPINSIIILRKGSESLWRAFVSWLRVWHDFFVSRKFHLNLLKRFCAIFVCSPPHRSCEWADMSVLGKFTWITQKQTKFDGKNCNTQTHQRFPSVNSSETTKVRSTPKTHYTSINERNANQKFINLQNVWRSVLNCWNNKTKFVCNLRLLDDEQCYNFITSTRRGMTNHKDVHKLRKTKSALETERTKGNGMNGRFKLVKFNVIKVIL